MLLERVTSSLRGELTRWLIEPRAGVFVGDVSAMVRDRLWDKCGRRLRGGGMMQIWTTNNEQGYQIRSQGLTDRKIVDYDGLQLVRLPHEPQPTRSKATDSPDD